MSKIFKRQELERLQTVGTEDIELVMKYQKKLPILIEDDNTFINSRDLHLQLGVSLDYSTWIKNQFQMLELTENVDFKPLLFKEERKISEGGANKKDYLITVSIGKEIAMLAGAKGGRTSKELIENSRIARKYFILMERIAKEHIEYMEIRDPEKIEYKRMCEAVDAWCFRIWHHNANRSEYAVEANGLNKIVTGLTSQELKIKYGCPTNELVRDYLKKDHNDELLFLEKQNQVLLAMDMGFTERMNMLAKMHEVTFKNKKVEKVA